MICLLSFFPDIARIMSIWFLLILYLTTSQNTVFPYKLSDCKHLILPVRCQCYHSDHESQLRCHKSELHSLPKLPNNMHWNALDFSYNYITTIDSYIFADIYVEKIILKSNYLRQIDITAFDQIQNLKQLLINNNQLKELDPLILKSPGVSLGMLMLKKNTRQRERKKTTTKFFSFQIEIFDLSHNRFQYLDIGQILLNLPLLKQFHLVSCNLNNTSIYTLLKLIHNTTNKYNQLHTGHGHYYLELLNLNNNNLTTICHHLFDGLYNLIELRLEHNFIRLIDNNFLRSLVKIKILNLAHNLLRNVPKLSSYSLKILNISSNHIRFLGAYFASNLNSIRIIDLDNNHHLNHTSLRAFCFLNIFSLEKLTFRSNNLISLHTFHELLCRLVNMTNKITLIDINHNVNLKCNCTLIQFRHYFNNYHHLTCIQQGQDRYYISKLTNWFSNCRFNICSKIQRQTTSDYCNWIDAQKMVQQGTCQTKLNLMKARKIDKSTIMTFINSRRSDNITEHKNLTMLENSIGNQKQEILKSNTISMKQGRFILFIIYVVFFLSL